MYTKYVEATFEMRSDNVICILPEYKYIKSKWNIKFADNVIESHVVMYNAKSMQLSPRIAAQFNNGCDTFDNAYQVNNFIFNNNLSMCTVGCKITESAGKIMATHIMIADITRLTCAMPMYNIRSPVRVLGKPNDYYFVVFYFQNMLGTYQYVLQRQDNGTLLARAASINGMIMLIMEFVAEENLY